MFNRKLYDRIIESVAYTVKKSLLERDLDAEGRWEFDEEIDDDLHYGRNSIDGECAEVCLA